MAFPSESRTSTDGTQLRSQVTEPTSAPQTEAADEGHTVYISFDAADAPAPDADSKQPPAAPADGTADPAELLTSQALELAATRAEVARQQRELDELNRALGLREGWLADLRKELKATQDEKQRLAARLEEALQTIELLTARIEKQVAQIAALEAQAAERMSMTTFGPDVPRTALGTRTELNHLANPPTLVPLDDEGEPIVLDRKVITVGRTRDNDVCVPSVLVSRAHARMVIGDDGVVLFDIGSINGSFVNDRPVKKHTLQDGDIVRFADRRYRFCQSALR